MSHHAAPGLGLLVVLGLGPGGAARAQGPAGAPPEPARLLEAPAPGPERAFSLEEALRLARRNSAAVLSAEKDIDIAHTRVQEAQLRFLPEVGVQASATKYHARYPFALAPEFRSILLFPPDQKNIYSARAYAVQTLYAGRRTTHLLKLAQTSLKEAQSRHQAATMDAELEAKRVFYQLIMAQERLRAMAEAASAAAGISTRPLSGWERVEAEAALTSLRARQAQARHAADLARLEFCRALNIELNTRVRVTGSLETRPISLDLAKAVVWAMELRPELQVETYRVQMDDIAVNLAMGRRIPTLVLAADYEVSHDQLPLKLNNWDATIGLRIPLPFDFYTQVRQKRAEARRGEIKRAERQDQVRLEVRRAYEEALFWQEEWQSRERDEVRLRTLAEAAAAGEPRPPPAVSLDRLKAQQGLMDARERYMEALHEHILSRARLERAVGRPIP